jgi:hypothetical protein
MPSTKKKIVDVELMKKRRAVIESRIVKLELKLKKDKDLLIKYTPTEHSDEQIE